MVTKTPAAILAECHAAGVSGIFMMSGHAMDRAEERNIGRKDVRKVLANATAATLQNNGRWAITGGEDLEGVAVTLIVQLVNGLLVVTLF